MSGSILADKCWFHLSPLSPCFSSVLPWHLTDKCGAQCVCIRRGLQQWHAAFSTEKPFSSAHGGSLSHKCFCFIFWLRILCLQTSASDGTFETPAYSLQKKNGVLRKCEVSKMSLIHRLWSKEPQFAFFCGHDETNARFKLQLYFLPLLKFYFIVNYGIKIAMCHFLDWQVSKPMPSFVSVAWQKTKL